jgi:hypothetical protein
MEIITLNIWQLLEIHWLQAAKNESNKRIVGRELHLNFILRP